MEAFVDFMNAGSWLGTLAGAVLAACLRPVMTLIHEGGHALAALATGHPIAEDPNAATSVAPPG